MKPVDQDSFSDESAGTHGNCYAACIASILERPLADLAEFDRLYLAYHGPALQGRPDFAARQTRPKAAVQAAILTSYD